MTTVAETTAGKGNRTRADARRNRERIVAAAREVFVAHGPDAPLDEVARRAGIGNATLYRHFPDRDALVHEVVRSVLVRTVDHAESAAQETDAFTALCRFAHAAADEGIGAVCGMLVGGDDRRAGEPHALGRRLERAVDALMERAGRSGQVRPGVTTDDLVVAMSRLTRPLPGAASCPGPDEAAHRHLQLLLDGLRPPATSVPSTPAAP